MRYEKYLFRTLQDSPGRELAGMVVKSAKDAEAMFQPLFTPTQHLHDMHSGDQQTEEKLPREITHEMLEAAHRQAYDEGFGAGMRQGADEGYAKGMSEARSQLEAEYEAKTKEAVEKAVSRHHHALEASLQALNMQVMQAFGEAMEYARAEQADVLALAMSIAKKIGGEALKARAIDPLKALLAQVLDQHAATPEIVIHVAPELVELAKPVCERIARESGFKGSVQCQGWEGMAPGDCSIQWRQGSISRRAADIIRSVEEVLLNAAPAAPTPNPSEKTEN